MEPNHNIYYRKLLFKGAWHAIFISYFGIFICNLILLERYRNIKQQAQTDTTMKIQDKDELRDGQIIM